METRSPANTVQCPTIQSISRGRVLSSKSKYIAFQIQLHSNREKQRTTRWRCRSQIWKKDGLVKVQILRLFHRVHMEEDSSIRKSDIWAGRVVIHCPNPLLILNSQAHLHHAFIPSCMFDLTKFPSRFHILKTKVVTRAYLLPQHLFCALHSVVLAQSGPCTVCKDQRSLENVNSITIIVSCSLKSDYQNDHNHTWYLSFFLHGQYF